MSTQNQTVQPAAGRRIFSPMQKLALGGVLTALVVVLQMLGLSIRFGPFSVSLVLIPIVIGAATCGPWIGGWLGLVFGAVVLLSGDAAPFLAVHAPGTVLTVLLKGALCGLAAGFVYRLFGKWTFAFKNLQTGKESWDINLGVILAAVAAPVVNTGVFLLGCWAFFMPLLSEWAAGMGYENVAGYMFFGLVGGNFLFELLFNIVLSPVIVRVLEIFKKVH